MSRINQFRGSKQVPNNTQFNSQLPNVNIDVKNLNSLIYNQGVRVKLYKTLFCPNVKSIDGAEHQLNCPICKDKQFVDVSPQETFAFIQGINMDNQISPESTGSNYEEQTAMASFIGGIDLTYYDKIELLDYSEVYKQTVQRQPGTLVDRLHFIAKSASVALDQYGNLYNIDTDFIVDRNGDIEWLNNGVARKPNDNVIYSIYYQIAVMYRALRALHAQRFGNNSNKVPQMEVIDYPQQWIVKKIWLFNKEDSESGVRLEANSINPRGI